MFVFSRTRDSFQLREDKLRMRAVFLYRSSLCSCSNFSPDTSTGFFLVRASLSLEVLVPSNLIGNVEIDGRGVEFRCLGPMGRDLASFGQKGLMQERPPVKIASNAFR